MFHISGQPDNCRSLSPVPPSPPNAEEEHHVFVPEPQLEGTFLPLRVPPWRVVKATTAAATDSGSGLCLQ